MTKKIVITGATSGLGLATAKEFVKQGHNVLIHGRNEAKIEEVVAELTAINPKVEITSFKADLSKYAEIIEFKNYLNNNYRDIDVLINNAGVFGATSNRGKIDGRVMTNIYAPYILTKAIAKLMKADGRIINLSSAAQEEINLGLLSNKEVANSLDEFSVYAQGKYANIIISKYYASLYEPTIISVNPGSYLSTKMVKETFNMSGNDIMIGVKILMSLALDKKHLAYSGMYFDNDQGKYNEYGQLVYNLDHEIAVINQIEDVIMSLKNSQT